MYHQRPSIGNAHLLGTALCVLVIGFISVAVCAEIETGVGEETEILKITVGEPTKLSPQGYQHSAVLAAARTGVVAAFYPNHEWIPSTRISKDGGKTWSEEVPAPRGVEGVCPGSVGLRVGEVEKRQLGQPLEMLQTGVGDLGVGEVDTNNFPLVIPLNCGS